MASDDFGWIENTLTYLQNSAPLTPAERQPAYDLAKHFVEIQFPKAARKGRNSPHKALAKNLSMGHSRLPDTDPRRHAQRALYLLWWAIQQQEAMFQLPFAETRQIIEGTASGELEHYIRKARCVNDARTLGSAGASHVLTQVFQTDAVEFMSHNKVFVSGSTKLNESSDDTNVRTFNFGFNAAKDRYEFSPSPISGGASIEVESVTAFHWTDPRYLRSPEGGTLHQLANANFNNMTGIKLSGEHPMVTTQFTGCSFCMAKEGGSVYCAHVAPGGVPNKAPDTTGDALARRIIATKGAFENAENRVVQVFGRDVGTGNEPSGYSIGEKGGYMTLVGFPAAGTYSIYSQTTLANEIAGVPKKIFG